MVYSPYHKIIEFLVANDTVGELRWIILWFIAQLSNLACLLTFGASL